MKLQHMNPRAMYCSYKGTLYTLHSGHRSTFLPLSQVHLIMYVQLSLGENKVAFRITILMCRISFPSGYM